MKASDFNDRLDLIQVVSEYVDLKKTGRDYSGMCPFHDDNKTPSFRVSPSKGIYKCFTCEVGGNALDFYKRINNIKLPQAMEELAAKYNIDYTPSVRGESYKKYYECMEEAATFFQRKLWENRPALEHLMDERGISKESIMKFRLGYSPNSWEELYRHLKSKGHSHDTIIKLGLVRSDEKGTRDFFRNRLMIPITSFGTTRVIGFGGRILDGKGPKYMNSPESPIFKKGENLFASSGVVRKISERGYAMIVEGYFDLIAANQAGFDTAVAGLGTAFTDGQGKLLKKHSNNILTCYDNDDAGVKACVAVITLLSKIGMNIKVISIEGAKDIDEILKREKGREEFLEFVRNSRDGIVYLVDALYGEKVEDYNEAIKKLERCKETYCKLEGIPKEQFIRELRVKTGYGMDTLRVEMDKVSPEIAKRREREEEKTKRKIEDARKMTLELLEGKGLKRLKHIAYRAEIMKCSDLDEMREIYKTIKKMG